MSSPFTLATPRTPSRPTRGGAVAKIAAATATPFAPWQRHVADVALEMLPDGSWAYPDVIVTVQRQAGKTTLLNPVGIHRCLTRPYARCWYTAQTRQDARDTLIDDYAPRFEHSPLAATLRGGRARQSQGSEGLYFVNGSAWRVFSTGEEALHGKANELVVTDEWWAAGAVEGAALAGAILPTFTTTAGQWWKVSTAGTAKSVPLREAVDRGRAAVAAGAVEGTAYFECSLPDRDAPAVEAGLEPGADPALLEVALELLLAAHPMRGRTLKISALRNALTQMPVGDFLRGFGNRWSVVAESVIPAAAWTGAKATSWPPPVGPVALGFEVGLDRVDAAIGAVWRDQDGRARIDIIEHAPGADWLPARFAQLASTWSPRALVCDGVGPVLDVADQLERAGLDITRLKTREYATACPGFLAELTDGTLTHPGHPALDAAAAAAAKRLLGDGGWVWGRVASAGSIAPLVAVTVARYGLDHAPLPASRPRLVIATRTAGTSIGP